MSPVTVNLQFPTRWWTPLAAGEQPGISGRVMGESSCLSRIEWPNTPEFAGANVIRAAYSDGLCLQTYSDMDQLPEPLRTNTVIEFVVGELRRLFPEVSVPNPIGYPWSGNASDYVGASFHIWCVPFPAP